MLTFYHQCYDPIIYLLTLSIPLLSFTIFPSSHRPRSHETPVSTPYYKQYKPTLERRYTYNSTRWCTKKFSSRTLLTGGGSVSVSAWTGSSWIFTWTGSPCCWARIRIFPLFKVSTIVWLNHQRRMFGLIGAIGWLTAGQ